MAGPSSHLTKITVNCGDNDNGHTGHHNSETTLTLTLCCLQWPGQLSAQCAGETGGEVATVSWLLQHLGKLSHNTQQTLAHSHAQQFMYWKNFKLFNVLHKVSKFSTPTCLIGNGHWWHDCQDWWKWMHIMWLGRSLMWIFTRVGVVLLPSLVPCQLRLVNILLIIDQSPGRASHPSQTRRLAFHRPPPSPSSLDAVTVSAGT